MKRQKTAQTHAQILQTIGSIERRLAKMKEALPEVTRPVASMLILEDLEEIDVKTLNLTTYFDQLKAEQDNETLARWARRNGIRIRGNLD